MNSKVGKHSDEHLVDLFSSRLLDGDFSACNDDIDEFLKYIRKTEKKFDPKRYFLAHKQYMRLREKDSEALLRIVRKGDFFGILTSSDPAILQRELDVLFPKMHL